MKKISCVLFILPFLMKSHLVHAVPLELHGLRPFPNIFIKLPDQMEEGEENVASLEEVRVREEEVILRYSKDPSGQSTSKYSDNTSPTQTSLKYPHDDSSVVQPGLKYTHDDPSAVAQPGLKYPHDDSSVVVQPALKYPHDDPSVVAQPELEYPHNLTQMLLKIPVVVVKPTLKYPHDDPSVVAQSDLKYSHDDPSIASEVTLRYSQAAAEYPPASRSPLIEWDDPDFLNILYKKEIHLYEWDERRRDSWIRKIDENLQRDICLDLGDDCLDTFQVGSIPNAKFAVIFVHGAIDYKKELGVTDIGFGGNFNFLKNLVLGNGGVYFSPSFNLSHSEVGLMQKLISHIKSLAPQAKIAFACGSSGMVICSGIARNQEEMDVDGLIFLGGGGTPRLNEDLPFFANRTPMIIAHASYDSWESMKRFYDSVKEMDTQYPIQFQLYHGGVHGTPIRMINWQRSLNYLFSNSPDSQKR